MALHWDLSKCKDVESLKSKEEWPISDVIIIHTISVGLGSITEKNLDTWVERMSVLQLVHGSFVGAWVDEEKIPIYITRKDLAKRIGLTTNASTLSEAQFYKSVKERLQRNAVANIEYKAADSIEKLKALTA
jgi:hypothetical protein